jgi:hypothetical protein
VRILGFHEVADQAAGKGWVRAAVLAGFVLAWLGAGLHSLEACWDDGGACAVTGGASLTADSKEASHESHHDAKTCRVCTSAARTASALEESRAFVTVESDTFRLPQALPPSLRLPAASRERSPPVP